MLNDIFKNGERGIYWTIIIISDSKHQTTIIAAASFEYIQDYFHIDSLSKIENSQLEDWKKNVKLKWSALGEEVYRHPRHYDVYANTPEGESNCMDFLLNEANKK